MNIATSTVFQTPDQFTEPIIVGKRVTLNTIFA